MIDKSADLAQLVEQLIRNEQVVGSNPIISSIEHSRLPVLPEAFLCTPKSVCGISNEKIKRN